ncbi:lysophospholipid acyltransferase family protein [Brockia lithotrophica]|uniref:1-acyl-sn-glycerol-3-phosphate acyltransferase n=1 Tax=Brockia lithotrophica TaxID=933949 RepID=A0A660KTF3_9BACL|nr:lysophospholipid acyltransferase family protein [Brockia lithotrophica]RKQ83897.1 1-acyl-sn-glycerol-3-phosphate acyltransferase [Brockia lithotrophica]
MWYFYLLRPLVREFIRAYHRVRIVGRERFDPLGTYVVVGNHESALDPVYLDAFFPRPIYFMAKKELFASPVLGPLVRAFGAFPVNREAYDIGAVRRALRLLQEGKNVGIFPEGTRNPRLAEAALKHGAAFVSLKTGIPVLPVALVGTGRAFPKGARFIRPARVVLVYGRPLFPRSGEDAEGFAARIKEALTELYREGEGRTEAGEDEARPNHGGAKT